MPTIHYDPNCRFCTSQIAILKFFDILEIFQYESQESLKKLKVVADNREYDGAEAVRYIAARIPAFWWSLPLLYFPGLLPLWQILYDQFAARRYIFGQCSNKCKIK